MSHRTALCSAIPPPAALSITEVRLRQALDQMAACLDNAHRAGWSDAAFNLLIAQGFARLAVVPDDWVFNNESVGACFRTGPYAGLGVVASILTESHRAPDIRHRDLFAQLASHARDLRDGVTPFADEMLHAGFQQCHGRVRAAIDKESHAQ